MPTQFVCVVWCIPVIRGGTSCRSSRCGFLSSCDRSPRPQEIPYRMRGVKRWSMRIQSKHSARCLPNTSPPRASALGSFGGCVVRSCADVSAVGRGVGVASPTPGGGAVGPAWAGACLTSVSRRCSASRRRGVVMIWSLSHGGDSMRMNRGMRGEDLVAVVAVFGIGICCRVRRRCWGVASRRSRRVL